MEKLHAGEIPGWASPPPPFLVPAAGGDVQGAAGQPRKWTWGPRGSHSSLIGDAEGPGVQRALGSPGLRKKKELKKKFREVRLPRAGGRTGDCGMWSRGRGVVLGGKEIFSSLNGNRDGVELFHWWG